MARNILFVGGERQVNLLDPLPRNLVPTANGLLGDQQNPEIVALPNGNFVVVYENDAGGGGDNDILAVEFTAAGVLVGNVFRVDFDAGDQFSPDVTPILTGGYAVAFEDNLAGNNDNSFVSLEVVPPGSLPDPDPEFVVEDPAGIFNETFDPSIATFANGSYIVTYTRFLDALNSPDTRFAIVNAAGNAHLTLPTALSPAGSASFDTAVATFGNIAAVVYASEELGGPLTDDVVLKIVNSSGAILDTEVINTAGERFNPEVAALTDGRFVIAWEDFITTDVYGRIYDPDTGAFSGPEFIISNRGGFQESVRVAALPDGGFVASWTDFSGLFGDNLAAINARRFDKNGVPVGDEFRVNTTIQDFQRDSGLASNADGVLFSAWVNFNTLNTTDTEPSGIQGQLLKAVTEVVNGTEGDDVIQTYGLGETINGLGGNDTIKAVGGNDKVDGGDGEDIIDAGSGNDTLGGGKGKGKLTGGDGLDSFLFDEAPKAANKQTITDFSHKDDTIVLDSATFKKLDPGKLAKKNYFEDEADDGNDFVGYRSGKVIYDKNGDDSGGDVVIAILKKSPDDFSKGDILII